MIEDDKARGRFEGGSEVERGVSVEFGDGFLARGVVLRGVGRIWEEGMKGFRSTVWRVCSLRRLKSAAVGRGRKAGVRGTDDTLFILIWGEIVGERKVLQQYNYNRYNKPRKDNLWD